MILKIEGWPVFGYFESHKLNLRVPTSIPVKLPDPVQDYLTINSLKPFHGKYSLRSKEIKASYNRLFTLLSLFHPIELYVVCEH